VGGIRVSVGLAGVPTGRPSLGFYSEIGGDIEDAVKAAAAALGDNTHRHISAQPWSGSRPNLSSPPTVPRRRPCLPGDGTRRDGSGNPKAVGRTGVQRLVAPLGRRPGLLTGLADDVLERQRRPQRVDDLTRSFGGFLGDCLVGASADRGQQALDHRHAAPDDPLVRYGFDHLAEHGVSART